MPPRRDDPVGSIVILGELKRWHRGPLACDGTLANELDR